MSAPRATPKWIFALSALAFVATAPAMAMKGGAGLASGGPDCAVTASAPQWRSVWLGHFTGGRRARNEAGDASVAWRDNYSCFPSRAACEGWLGTMRAAWRPVEGYRSCLLVRNGPMQGPPAWIATPYDRDMDRSFE